MARSGRRQKKRDQQYTRYTVAVGLVVLLLLGGFGYAWWSSQSGGLDSRLCPRTGPKAHTIVLIDKTDKLPAVQDRALRQLVSEVATRHSADFNPPAGAEQPLKVGELLSVFILGEDYRATPDPIFERCNPGKGEDAGVWFANPEKLEKLYKTQYDDKLLLVSQQLFPNAASKWSPIMEMLQMISINGFKRSAVNGPRRLIVVSDMLHNTGDYSHFREIVHFDNFKKTTYFQKVSTDLSRTEVHLRYLMLSPALQTMKLNKFWEDYFNALDASVRTAKPLQ